MTTFIRLEQYCLIEATGDEAEKYLQGQLTTDVCQLRDGQSTLTAHCDPQGKVTSIFRLIRLNRHRFFLLIKRALLPSALAALKKYAVFSKIVFQPLDWQLIGLVGKKCGQIQAEFSIELPDERAILLHPTSLPVVFNGSVAQWECLDIQAGLPNLSPQTQNLFIPQALNLQVIEQAISFSKGCYIGQETVARAKYRGANKRALFNLKSDSADGREYCPELGTGIEMQLESQWRKTGTIISAVNIDHVLWLQVVMNNDIQLDTPLRLPQNGAALTIQPLPYVL